MEYMFLILIVGLMIFMVMNTRKKQRAQQENISTNLVPGAGVMTTFGLLGTVVSINEETSEVVIESGPGTTIRVHKQAIGRIDPIAVPDMPNGEHEAIIDETETIDEAPKSFGATEASPLDYPGDSLDRPGDADDSSRDATDADDTDKK